MSVFVVGGAAAGLTAAIAVPTVVGLSGAAAMTLGGAAVGSMMKNSRNKAPASASGNMQYTSESLYEKLLAQSDPKLAGQLYAREANQDYGRPAYARLEQELMQDAIVGQQHTVDQDGYVTRTNYGEIPEGGRMINSEAEQFEYYVDSNPDLRDSYQREGGNKAEWGFNHWQSHGQKEGRSLAQVGSMIDSEGNNVKGEQVREYVGKEFAGKKINTGGVASTIAGNQQRDFYDEEGNKITKRAGFDEEGNFQGTAQLATDVAFDTQQQTVRQEMGLMEEHGKRITDAYRDQGDIRGALNKVKVLDEVSALDGVSRSPLDGQSSALRSSMLNEAIMGMNAGGGLTDRESRAAQQAARSAMQARGRVNDFAGIMAEMELNEKYRKDRRAERFNFAGQVMNSEQGLMDRQTARDQLYQSGLAQDRSNATARLGSEMQTSADPYAAITGKDSGAGLAAGTNMYAGAAGAADAGSNMYNPHTGMAFDQQTAANRDTYNATVYGADKAAQSGLTNTLINTAASIYKNSPT